MKWHASIFIRIPFSLFRLLSLDKTLGRDQIAKKKKKNELKKQNQKKNVFVLILESVSSRCCVGCGFTARCRPFVLCIDQNKPAPCTWLLGLSKWADNGAVAIKCTGSECQKNLLILLKNILFISQTQLRSLHFFFCLFAHWNNAQTIILFSRISLWLTKHCINDWDFVSTLRTMLLFANAVLSWPFDSNSWTSLHSEFLCSFHPILFFGFFSVSSFIHILATSCDANTKAFHQYACRRFIWIAGKFPWGAVCIRNFKLDGDAARACRGFTAAAADIRSLSSQKGEPSFLPLRLFLRAIPALQHCSWSCFPRRSLFKWRGLYSGNHRAECSSRPQLRATFLLHLPGRSGALC